MKRLSALLIAFALSLSLTACGGEPDTPSASSSQGSAPSESSIPVAAASTEVLTETPVSDSSALEAISSEEPSSEVEQPEEQPEQAEPVAVVGQEPDPEPAHVETPATSEPAPEPDPEPEPEPQQPEVTTPAPSTPVETPPAEDPPAVTPQTGYVIGNRNSKKYHEPTCSSVNKMKESNKVVIESGEAAIAAGYEPCKNCH